jgi:hypothetical protein
MHTRTDSNLALQSGFTEDVNADGTGFEYKLARRVATTAGAQSYSPYTTALSNVWGILCVVIQKNTYDRGLPINASAFVANSTTTPDAGLDPPSITTTVADCLSLTALMEEFSGAVVNTITPPSTWTTQQDLVSTGAQVDGQVAYKALGAAGATNPGTFADNQAAESTANIHVAIAPPQGYASVVATSTYSSGSNSTSHVVPMPEGVEVGDLLLMTARSVNETITWPSGWTQIHNRVGSAQLAAAYKISDGTEGADETVTLGASNLFRAVVERIVDHDPSSPPVAQSTTGANGTSANPDPPSFSPAAGSKKYLWHASAVTNAASMSAGPSSYIGYLASVSVAVAHRRLESATENPGTFTSSASSGWTANTVAISPAVPGVTGAATLSGTATIAAVGGVVHPGAAALSTSGATISAAAVTYVGAASLVGTATIQANGTGGSLLGFATVESNSAVDAAGSVVLGGSADLVGSATIDPHGGINQVGASELVGTSDVTAIGSIEHLAQASLSASGSSISAAAMSYAGKASLEGSATMEPSAVVAYSASAILTTNSIITVDGALFIPPSVETISSDAVNDRWVETGIVLDQPIITYDLQKIRNVVEVKGHKAEGCEQTKFTAHADRKHPLSPWSLARNGEPRYIVEVIENGEIRRKEKAKEKAERVLRRRLRAAVDVEFECLPVPHLEEDDVCTLIVDNGGTTLRINEFHVKRFTIPLTAEGTMSIGSLKRRRKPLFKRSHRKRSIA